jgi:hypothetical protein
MSVKMPISVLSGESRLGLSPPPLILLPTVYGYKQAPVPIEIELVGGQRVAVDGRRGRLHAPPRREGAMVKKDHLALNLALNFANMGVKTGFFGLFVRADNRHKRYMAYRVKSIQAIYPLSYGRNRTFCGKLLVFLTFADTWGGMTTSSARPKHKHPKRRKKPKKPSPEYRLYPHASGQWACKLGRQMVVVQFKLYHYPADEVLRPMGGSRRGRKGLPGLYFQ